MAADRPSALRRLVLPVAPVLLAMAAATLAYNLSWRIEDDSVHQATALLSGIVLFASIGFGALFTYPMAFFQGAAVAERILACLATPLAWNLKEMVRVSEFFTAGETLYYGINSIFLLTVIGTFAQMGICEMVCRRSLARRGRTHVRVVTAVPVLSVLLGIAAVAVMLVWGRGVHWFYIYMEGYKALFLAGC
ncbi:MAG: hypothetical protein AB1640_23975 [bacterium]